MTTPLHSKQKTNFHVYHYYARITRGTTVVECDGLYRSPSMLLGLSALCALRELIVQDCTLKLPHGTTEKDVLIHSLTYLGAKAFSEHEEW